MPARAQTARRVAPAPVATRRPAPPAPVPALVRPAGGPPAIRLTPRAQAPPSPGQLPEPVSLAIRNVGPGESLPAATQKTLEHTLDISLEGVHVHTDARAGAAAGALNARAFTYGLHIFLGTRERPTDVALMAHEITHVVQQRGAPVLQTYAPGGDRFEREAEQTAGAAQSGGKATIVERTEGSRVQAWRIPIISDVVDWVEDRVWDLLERFAPSLVPILRMGVLTWLKERLSGFLETIIDVAARPVRAIGEVVSGIRRHFGNLVGWLQEAGARIARNDCGPISEAADKIYQVFEGLASPIVDRVKHYATKVKEFFQDLWNRFGAPVWDLLRRIGGAIWERIEQIGRWIWEKTQPVRNWLARAWRWLKNQIGIGEGEEGQNGILQWFQRKASAAWDWVMARIGPFKRPLLIIAGVLVMLSPAGPLIAIGAAAAGILRGIQWIRQNLRTRGAVARQQSFLRGTILPAILGAIDSVSRIVRRIANAITGALGRAVEGLTNLSSAVSSIPILSFASGLVDWIVGGFRGLLSWAREGVQGVANWLESGLQGVGQVARRLIDLLEEIGRLVRNFFRIVGATFRRIWHAIPKCIRDPLVDYLIPLILRQIPFFSELAATPEAWQQTRAQVSTLLVQVFVNFDLIGAMKTVFRLVVRILRIPVELIGQLLDKAAQAWDAVLARPIRFISNALKAILMGVGFFIRNFLSHLWFGVQGWLLNAVERSGTGIRPPTSWDFRGIFGFVLDVLGLSLDHVIDLLALRLGRPLVNRIRQALNILTGVWGWVKVAIEEGPAGLWRKLVDQLSNLATAVLEAAVGWVLTRIFAIVSARLAAMAASAGFSAILEAIFAVYQAIRTALEYLPRIIQMMIRVFDGIIQIAGGVLDPAARTLETAFRNAMPILIGFLANYAGLGGIGGRIREIILDVRTRVDNAILWLIDRAIAAGRWLLDRLRAGVAAMVLWWRRRVRFAAADGQQHSLYYRGEGRDARLWIESDPTPFETFIQNVPTTQGPKQEAKTRAVVKAREMDVLRNRASTTDGTLAPADERRLEVLWNELTPDVALLFGTGAASTPQYGATTSPAGWGSGMVMLNLVRRPRGSRPSVSNRHFEDLNLRRHGNVAAPSVGSYYILGHLLNEELGGPGNSWGNITPLSRSGNAQHVERVEESVKAEVSSGKSVRYEVMVRYGRAPSSLLSEIPANTTDALLLNKRKVLLAEQHLPSSLLCRAFRINAATGAADSAGLNLTREVPNEVMDRSLDDYVVPGQAAQRLKVLAINDSIRHAGSPGKHRDALLRLPGVGTTRLEELIHGGVAWTSLSQISDEVDGVTSAIANGWARALDHVTVVLNGTSEWE